MPTICEICGRVEESSTGELLHVCPDCIGDRRPEELSASGSAEDAAD